MNRKNFIANTLMAFAAALVPKILQPNVPEIQGDERKKIMALMSKLRPSGYMINIDALENISIDGLSSSDLWIRSEGAIVKLHTIER